MRYIGTMSITYTDVTSGWQTNRQTNKIITVLCSSCYVGAQKLRLPDEIGYFGNDRRSLNIISDIKFCFHLSLLLLNLTTVSYVLTLSFPLFYDRG